MTSTPERRGAAMSSSHRNSAPIPRYGTNPNPNNRRTVMRGRTSVALLTLAVLAAACSAPAETSSTPTTSASTSTSASAVVPKGPAVITPLVASVVAAPIPVPATDGKVHLAYELL